MRCRSGAARFADPELGRQDHHVGSLMISAQEMHCGPADLDDGLDHGRQQWVGGSAVGQPVEADDGDISGDLQAVLAQRPQRALSHRVGGNEQRVGLLAQNRQGCSIPALDTWSIESDQLIVRRSIVGDECAAIAVESFDAVQVVRRGSDESHPLTPEPEEVCRGSGAPGAVLDIDSAKTLAVCWMSDDCQVPPSIAQRRDHLIAERAGGGDDTIEEALRHQRGEQGSLAELSIEGEDREDRTCLGAAVVDSVDECRVVRVTEQFVDLGRYHETDQAGPIGDQRTRSLVREVARLLDDRFDAGSDLRPHVGMLVEHSRHGRPRDTRELPDRFECEGLGLFGHGVLSGSSSWSGQSRQGTTATGHTVDRRSDTTALPDCLPG